MASQVSKSGACCLGIWFRVFPVSFRSTLNTFSKTLTQCSTLPQIPRIIPSSAALNGGEAERWPNFSPLQVTITHSVSLPQPVSGSDLSVLAMQSFKPHVPMRERYLPAFTQVLTQSRYPLRSTPYYSSHRIRPCYLRRIAPRDNDPLMVTFNFFNHGNPRLFLYIFQDDRRSPVRRNSFP